MESPTKILMFVPFYPPHTGGVEYYAEELALYLSQSGCTITILTPQIPGTARYTQLENIQIIPYPAFEIIHNYPIPKFWRKNCWKIMSNLRNNPPNIIITHTRFFLSSFIGALFSAFTRTPHLHIEHGSSFVQSENIFIAFIAWFYDHTFGRYILYQSASVVAVSESVKNFLEVVFQKSRINIIYRGFDAEKINSIAPNNTLWKPASDELKLIFVGRIIISKGIYELVTALASLPLQNWSCVFIGDGTEMQNLKKEIRLKKLSGKIQTIGFKSWHETISILKSSDILINPSYTEGLPTTVLEAALCGIPVIATDVGGTREISPCITLIPPKNSKALRNAIIKTLENIQEIKISNLQIASNIQEKFSWKVATPKFLSILKSLHS